MSTPGTNRSAHDQLTVLPAGRGEWLALAAVVIVATCARVYRLGLDSFWLDETASWWFASRPLAEQWLQIPFYEPHPPLYYGLLWLWSRVFGEGEAALRGLSALANVLTIPVVYAIGRVACFSREGHRIGLLAALLASLHPTQILYAQEARPYALLTLAVAVLLLALLWAVTHAELLGRSLPAVLRDSTSGMRRAVLTLVIATAAAFWLHNTALILVSSLLLVTVVLLLTRTRLSWQLFGNCVAIGLAVLVLWSPNIRWLISGMTEVTAGFWLQRPRWWDIMWVGDELLGSSAIAATVPWKVGITLFSCCLVVLGATALWRKGQGRAALLLTFAVFGPFALSVITSYVITPIFMTRVLVWVQIPAFVLVAANLLWLPSLFLRRSAAAIVVTFLAAVVITGWGRPQKEPWRDVARIIVEEAGPQDLIIGDTAYAQVPMLYYRVPEKSSAKWLPLPAAYPLPMGKSGYPDGFFLRGKIDAAMLDRVREAAASSRKVWHVTRGRTVYDLDQRIAQTLKAIHGPGTVRTTNGDAVLLTEYGPPPP